MTRPSPVGSKYGSPAPSPDDDAVAADPSNPVVPAELEDFLVKLKSQMAVRKGRPLSFRDLQAARGAPAGAHASPVPLLR